ncbi:MAG: ribonuclease Z [Bacteroidales bacterium]|nr:ribonuclease Z [Bacteroidales bacterium]
MDFYITILGCSAALPTATRQCSSQVVNIDGYNLLIDCGEGTQNQIRRYRIKLQSMSDIFISHLHGDHFFGLPGLLSSMHLCGRTEPVNIYAPKGIRKILTHLFNASGAKLSFELVYHEIETQEPILLLENKKCKVFTFPLVHSVPTYGFLIEEQPSLPNLKSGVRKTYNLSPADILKIKIGEGYTTEEGRFIPSSALTKPARPPKKYAYCCDTLFDESFIPHIKDVDLLCFDCTFDSSLTYIANDKLHGTSVSAAMAAKAANAKQLLLTHFSARYNDVDSLVDEAKTIFPNTLAAYDGMRIKLGL